MKTIGDYFEETKVVKLSNILSDLVDFISIYGAGMEKEDLRAFNRVCDYIADLEVDKL